MTAPLPDAVSEGGFRVDAEAAEDVEPPAGLQPDRWISAALSAAGVAAVSVSLRWVGRAESAELNGTYRGKSGPTNVLAFPAPALPGLPVQAQETLGDLVVCVPVLIEEARVQGKTEQAHAAHLLVHGSLHLAGYDHLSEPAALAMEGLEKRVMKDLGFSDPYAAQPEHPSHE